MPTTYKPNLDHKTFSFAKAVKTIEAHVLPLRDQVLREIGFLDEYGEPEEWDDDDEEDAKRAIGEVVGVVAKAAAIRVDAGFKPTNQVRATVAAIARDPRLLRFGVDRIEPEAVGAIAKHYKRGDERPGTHWADITGDGDRRPTIEQVRVAAQVAERELELEARKGGRSRVDLQILAEGLGSVYGRPITRTVGTMGRAAETGGYKTFLGLVLPALEGVLRCYEPRVRPISRDSLVRRTIHWRDDQRRALKEKSKKTRTAKHLR